jgi:predicted nucleic acid-binding protein
MESVFLDANVLFSAAYREDSGLLRLWKLPKVELSTSGYAIEEAQRNLEAPEARSRLNDLLTRLRVVPEAPHVALPASIRLAEKDQPILRCAIASGAGCLLTGDIKDFRSLFGKRIAGVLVQTPGDFLRGRRI